MNWKKDDWWGLGASLGVHAALLVLFALLATGRPAEQQLGFVEVEIGPYAQGQPVEAAEVDQPGEAEEQPAETPEDAEEPQPEAEPPAQPEPEEAADPVDLPEQEEPVEAEEEVVTPEKTTDEPTIPAEPTEEKEEAEEPQPESEPAAASGGGAEEGRTGAEEGDEGEGAEEEEAAPFNIEGLNRDKVAGPLPQYAEKVNAVIRVRITVDPQGRVVERLPLVKGNPALERSVMDALTRWRFNPLPPGAPQERQSGIVTFRFRLE